jgi:K+-sensing histidine kinase KdpD
VGVLSHEIRTPIATLYAMSGILRAHQRSMQPEEVDECLDGLESEADRLRRLTEDLLVLSRTDGDRLEVARNPVALRPLAATVVKRERVVSPRHEIVLDVSDSVPLVLGEEGYLEQVLGNYLSNATKYSPPTTTVRVSVEPDREGVAVRVVDAGLGLPAGAEERVFDLFYRAPEAIANAGGTGVGLYVCRKLIEAMDGRVWATPLPGTGTEFGFWLPAVELAPEEE